MSLTATLPILPSASHDDADRARSFYRAIWLFPAAFAFHILEVDVGVVTAGALGMLFIIWSGLYHFGSMPSTWLPFCLH